MRIISKFKDYYDSASGYGEDPKCIYVRDTHKKHLDEISYPIILEKATWSDPYKSLGVFNSFTQQGELYFTEFFGICGKVYPLFGWESLNKDGSRSVSYSDDPEDVLKLFKILRYSRDYKKKSFLLEYKRYVEAFVEGDKALDLFIELEAPLIYFSRSRPYEGNIFYGENSFRNYIVANPNLTQTSFKQLSKIDKDPSQLYQRISGFLTGVLSGLNDNMIQTDELSRLDASGIGRDAMVGHNQPKKRKKKNKRNNK